MDYIYSFFIRSEFCSFFSFYCDSIDSPETSQITPQIASFRRVNFSSLFYYALNSARAWFMVSGWSKKCLISRWDGTPSLNSRYRNSLNFTLLLRGVNPGYHFWEISLSGFKGSGSAADEIPYNDCFCLSLLRKPSCIPDSISIVRCCFYSHFLFCLRLTFAWKSYIFLSWLS